MKQVYELTTQEMAEMLAAFMVWQKKANEKDIINYQVSMCGNKAIHTIEITKAKQ